MIDTKFYIIAGIIAVMVLAYFVYSLYQDILFLKNQINSEEEEETFNPFDFGEDSENEEIEDEEIEDEEVEDEGFEETKAHIEELFEIEEGPQESEKEQEETRKKIAREKRRLLKERKEAMKMQKLEEMQKEEVQELE